MPISILMIKASHLIAFITLLWSGLALAEESSEGVTCSLSRTGLPLKEMHTITRAIRAKMDQDRRQLWEGTTTSCRSLGGVYQVQTKNGDQETWRFSPLEDELRDVVFSDDISQVYLFQKLQPKNEKPHGLVIEKDGKFYRVERPIPIKLSLHHPYDNSTKGLRYKGTLRQAEQPVMELVRDFRLGLASTETCRTLGIKITPIEFDPRMTSAASPDMESIRYDGMATVDDFLSATRVPQNPNSLEQLLGYPAVRVPPEMYALAEQPEFQNAIRNRQYSKVIDIIWQQALRLSNGDPRKAAYVALLFTDLRQRGPCGAVFGLRGRSVVPTSLFDGEAPSQLVENRLDATQHFFGYTLMQLEAGNALPKAVSEMGKERQRYFPRVSVFFDRFHGVSESGYDNSIVSPLRLAYSGGGEKFATTDRVRTDIEIDVDKFYNDLGMEFGRTLRNNPKAPPSSVINSAAADERKGQLGLKPSTHDWEWQAYDPHRQVPKVFLLPPEQRSDIRVPLDMRRQRPSATTMKAYRHVCQNGFYEDGYFDLKLTDRACRGYQEAMQIVVDQLYISNHSPPTQKK